MKKIYTDRQLNFFEEQLLLQVRISEDYKILDTVLNDKSLVKELAKDLPDAAVGRNRTSAERILRMLVLKHQKQLSYGDMARQLNYDIEDRWFCRIDKAPCFKTIQNQLALISEQTIKNINDRILSQARKQKLTNGKRMRVDSTATEMNIHYPTDAGLIKDAMGVMGRLLKKSGIKNNFFKNIKAKLKKPLALLRTIGRRNKEVAKEVLSEVAEIGRQAVDKTKHLKDKFIRHYRGLLDKVVRQAMQVSKGNLKIKNRIVSVFEPTARAIRRGKAGKPTEFGKVVQIQEDEAFVTGWQISGVMKDEAFLTEALKKHRQLFQKAPDETATDRGYWSPENFELLKRSKVKHISLPKKGKLNSQEKLRQRTYHFKKLQRWRAGGEAKISWLKRKFGLRRCLNKGEDGFARWVGAGILANNLIVMARLLNG